MTRTDRICGFAAITYAAKHGTAINKYTDPTEGELDDIDAEYATEVAREGESLIWTQLVAGVPAEDDTIEWYRAPLAHYAVFPEHDGTVEVD